MIKEIGFAVLTSILFLLFFVDSSVSSCKNREKIIVIGSKIITTMMTFVNKVIFISTIKLVNKDPIKSPKLKNA